VRTAELLTRDGLKAYDGAGCRDIPILSGIMVDAHNFSPARMNKPRQRLRSAQKYTSPTYVVPKPIPVGAIVVAANAGKRLSIRPGWQYRTVKTAVRACRAACNLRDLRERQVWRGRRDAPHEPLKTENSGNGRAPDIISASASMKTWLCRENPAQLCQPVNRKR